MNEKKVENPLAQDFADKIQAMNRKARRNFGKKNKLPFKVYGSTKPFIKYGTRTNA